MGGSNRISLWLWGAQLVSLHGNFKVNAKVIVVLVNNGGNVKSLRILIKLVSFAEVRVETKKSKFSQVRVIAKTQLLLRLISAHKCRHASCKALLLHSAKDLDEAILTLIIFLWQPWDDRSDRFWWIQGAFIHRYQYPFSINPIQNRKSRLMIMTVSCMITTTSDYTIYITAKVRLKYIKSIKMWFWRFLCNRCYLIFNPSTVKPALS